MVSSLSRRTRYMVRTVHDGPNRLLERSPRSQEAKNGVASTVSSARVLSDAGQDERSFAPGWCSRPARSMLQRLLVGQLTGLVAAQSGFEISLRGEGYLEATSRRADRPSVHLFPRPRSCQAITHLISPLRRPASARFANRRPFPGRIRGPAQQPGELRHPTGNNHPTRSRMSDTNQTITYRPDRAQSWL